MSSDDYQVQNIYRYSRKTFKKNRRGPHDNGIGPLENTNYDAADTSPRSDIRSDGRIDSNIDSPGCSCDLDPEGEIANILHKKCPVITLAQQQLARLLDETDKLLCDNTRCCRKESGPLGGLRGDTGPTRRGPYENFNLNWSGALTGGSPRLHYRNTVMESSRSVYDFVCLCKDIFVTQDKCRAILAMLICIGFFMGVLIGAASCGSYLGKFNSPILCCIDNYFASDRFSNVEDSFRSIA